MDVLVVDLTHGGVKIAVELEKLGDFNNIYAYDIYNTLKKDEKQLLKSHNIELLDVFKDNLNFKELLVVNPVHSPFDIYSLLDSDEVNIKDSDEVNIKDSDDVNIKDSDDVNIKDSDDVNIKDSDEVNIKDSDEVNIKEITHHEAVKLILKKWKEKLKVQDIPVIEVTGVKGKTSVVAMLKEIMIAKDPLILSSLGAVLYYDNKELSLKENISITPASILETTDLAKTIVNPKDINKFPYNSTIFESSLGVTGLGDIGVLTNIVENYPIAKDTSNAKEAKEQVFNCDIVIIEKETLETYYHDKLNSYTSEEFQNKINTFSFDDKNSNLFLNKVKYGLNKTFIDINYSNIKTKAGELISGSFSIETFAPGPHNVANVLATVTTALSLNIHEDFIKKGLTNFKGIKGRTSLKMKDNFLIIEEINPGINTKAIESSIKMIKNLEDYTIILGGKYGVTCEEIDENKVAILLDEFIDRYNVKKEEKVFDLILAEDLGNSISKLMKNKVEYIKDPIVAQNLAISNGKNVLFIYRSNYSQINKR